ncbi:SdrD B-like domain-containing protein, partial [Chitiniphilus shinanonensis]
MEVFEYKRIRKVPNGMFLVRFFLFLSFLFLYSTSQAAANVQVTTFDDAPDPVFRNGTLTYTIKVENVGDQTATGVVVSTSVPTYTTFVSASDARCALSGGKVVCNFGAMVDTGPGGGAPISYTINLKVASNTPDGTLLSSTTTISSTSPDDDLSNNTKTQVTTAVVDADLSLVIGGSTTAVAGGPVSYTVNVTNHGPDAATSTVFVFTPPAGVSVTSGTGTGWTCLTSVGTLTCRYMSSAAAAGVTLPPVTLTGKVTSAGALGIATVSATTSSQTPDRDFTNNTATFDTAISAGTDLEITKTTIGTHIAGSSVRYVLRPRNLGPMDAANVVVVDTMPPGYVVTSTSGTGWSCSTAGQIVTCSRDSFVAGGAADINIYATVPAGGTFTNTATISSDTPDGYPANNTGTNTNTIQANQSNLGIAKTKTPNKVVVGGQMTSQIVVTNNGPATRNPPIVVTESLGANEVYVGSSGTDWSCALTVATPPQTVTCTYSKALANAGKSSTLSIQTQATGLGPAVNTVRLIAATTCPATLSQCDDDPSNDTASASSDPTAQQADLALVKSIPDPADDPLQPADNQLTYRLAVTNRGPDTATGITLSDDLPGYFSSTLVGTTGASITANTIPDLSCVIATLNVSCSGGTLADGASGYVDITLKRPLKDGVLANTALVDSIDVGDPDRSNNSSTISSTVQPVADLQAVSIIATPNTTPAGVDVTYVVMFRNAGPSLGVTPTITSTFNLAAGDSGFTLVSATPGNGTAACTGMTPGVTYTGSPQISCTWSTDWASGGYYTVTLVVRPNSMTSPPNPRTMPFGAAVSTPTYESVTTNNAATTVTTLTVLPSDADLLANATDADSVSAGPDPLSFNPANPAGNVITYQVTATNGGPSYANGVKLVNTLTPPAGKSFTFLCGSATPGGACLAECDNADTSFTGGASAVITCTAPSGLANGASYVRYLRFRVDASPNGTGDLYRLKVVASSDESDSKPLNNTAEEETTVRFRGGLELTKTASAASASLNEPFNWVMVLNNREGDSLNTTLADTLPSGMVFVGATPVTTSQGSCSVSGSQCNCNLGTVSNGASVTVTARVRQVGWTGPTVTNGVVLTSNKLDPADGDYIASGSIDIVRSSLSGMVYLDQAANGVLDSGTDSGIGGVTVQLSGTDPWGNVIDLSTTTDASGAFSFGNLPPANASGYTLVETQPGGYASVANTAGSAGGTVSGDTIGGIALAAGTDASGYLFGEGLGSGIAGTVYIDANYNGVRDGGEGGIPGTTITLAGTSSGGATIHCTTVTDANGDYVFPAPGATGACAVIPAGTYSLTETQPTSLGGIPTDFINVINSAGSAGGTVSGDVISGIVLAANASATGYRFGEIQTVGINGGVLLDPNWNGIWDPGETGINGVTITLTGISAIDGSAVSCSQLTFIMGAFFFPAADASGTCAHLPPGTYTLTETQPAGYASTVNNVGTNGGSVSGDVISGIVLTPGTTGLAYWFGEIEAASLSGSVYLDANHSGAREGGEPGIAGVTLTLAGTSGGGGAVSCSTVTDSNGDYVFPAAGASGACAAIPPGTYTLTETQPAGYLNGSNAAGSAGGTVSGDSIGGIVLASGSQATGYLFGDIQTTGLTGTVYLDANRNGAWDGGEPGISGVTLTLSDGAGLSCTTTTDINGAFAFPDAGASGACANIPPGSYTLTETQPANFFNGSNAAGTAGGTVSGDVISNIVLTASGGSGYLFGESQSVMFSGGVYEDANANGLWEPGENGINGVTITLTGTSALDGSAISCSTVTYGIGAYIFPAIGATGVCAHLPPGTYVLEETQPGGYVTTLNTLGNTGGTLSGDTISNIVMPSSIHLASPYLFGERVADAQPVGLAGAVYLDLNRNGVRDSGEAGLPGVTVTLSGVDALGAPLSCTAVTDANGSYAFPVPGATGACASLAAGTYAVSETQPAGYLSTVNTAGSAGGTVGGETIGGIVLAAGVQATDYLFGEVSNQPATLSGKVWIDYDHSRDENDARPGSGLAGWSVELLRAGTVLASTVTDAQGNYRFREIQPSSATSDYFSVRFYSPKGYVYGVPVSPEPPGQADFALFSAARSDREQPDGIAGLYLGGGANVTLQSLPLDPSGVVYDSVRRAPVADATVRLDGPAGFDPATHLAGGVGSQSQVTDASGIYQFLLLSGAPAGVYTLSLSAPAGYAPGVSTMIPPCANVLTVLSAPKPALVQSSISPPLLTAPVHAPSSCATASSGLITGRGSTQYYLQLALTPGQSANLVNNHLPVDPILSGALVVRKTSPLTNVQIGDLVPYTIVAQNTLAARLADVDLRDQLPPGFKYR